MSEADFIRDDAMDRAAAWETISAGDEYLDWYQPAATRSYIVVCQNRLRFHSRMYWAARRCWYKVKDHFGRHGLFARDYSHRRLFIWRRFRAARLSWEWHNHGGVRYIDVGIASPAHHRWWATKVTFYFSKGRGRQRVSDFLFGKIPSTGYRSWR